MIDVRHEHMLPAAAGSAHHAASRFDAFDDSLFGAFGPEPDDVSRCDDVPLIGRQRFEQAASGALDECALLVLDDTY